MMNLHIIFIKLSRRRLNVKRVCYPKIAELIQQDYDLKWFSEPDIRTVGDEGIAVIKQRVSPFKVEVAHYIDDNRVVADEELVLAIGKVSDLGLKGLSGIDSNEWYRNIVINDLDFTSDDLLQYAFPVLIKQNSGRLPVNKYLSEATQTYQECEALA